ncbi:MAG TPA: NAD(P)H-dependent oxidoreductase [Candidatus Acidoferrum sp.]|nr:NAD(P)H-dependent oxidoreductase [Candidatus Acidoferrum sp.]
MNHKLKIAVIYGSTRAGRLCDKIASWAAAQISARPEFELDLVDPASQSAAHNPSGHAIAPEWLSLHLGEADAFLVVTPEYNHGYPAALKSLIDSAGPEWHAKPVAFVSYGGISGGIRAAEQLRQVFAEMHAVTIRDSVTFSMAWEQFDEAGQLKHPARAERQMKTVLNRLAWWATALREARNKTPYAAAA